MAEQGDGRPVDADESTAQMLRAFSHPVRIRLAQVLLSGQSRNVSELADLIDEPPNSVSFHVRQLAKSGFVEQVPGPAGSSRRESWWRITAAGIDPVPIQPSQWTGHERAVNMANLRTMFTADFLDRVDGLLAALEERNETAIGYYEFHLSLTREEARRFAEQQKALLNEMRAASDAHAPGDGAESWTVAQEFFPELRPHRPWTDAPANGSPDL